MSVEEHDARYRPSVFDRLLDDAADRETDDAPGASERLRLLRESLRRDLEALFNTPASLVEADETRPEIERSLLRYGVTGFHGLDLATVERRQALASALRRTIVEHEPRLHDVRVDVGERNEQMRALRLRVTGSLRFENEDEPVAFDTVLDPAMRQFRVERLRRGGPRE